MTNAVSSALAEKREAPPTPRTFMMKHSDELTSVLPTHIQGNQGEAWLRLAAGALKVGKTVREGPQQGMFELEAAAQNNPAAFMQALRKAASMGLQPGTEQFYLTTVRNRDNGNRTEILGITGYKGYIELMYRGGHVASVIVDTVHEGEEFDFVRGRDSMPMHRVNWRAKRGKLELVYAYAKMHSGAISNVVILNEDDIDEIKQKSSSFKFNPKNSPWTTDTRAMWLKSAVRRLQTWVPWSIEIHAAGGLPILPASPVGAPAQAGAVVAPPVAPQLTDGVAKLNTENPEHEVIDATLVEPEDEHAPPEDEAPAEPAEPQMTKAQLRKMQVLFGEKGFKDTDQRHAFVMKTLPGIGAVENSGHLSVAQAVKVIDALEHLPTPATEEASNVPSGSPAGQ